MDWIAPPARLLLYYVGEEFVPRYSLMCPISEMEDYCSQLVLLPKHHVNQFQVSVWRNNLDTTMYLATAL